MKLHAIKILTDENISPKVVAFLRQAGVDVRDVKEEAWFGTADEALLDIAYQEDRFVLTHDADFGALAIHQGKPCYGILYLRLKNINPATIIRVWSELLQKELEIAPQSIWVIEESRVRIRYLAGRG